MGQSNGGRIPVAIYGAGSAGLQLVSSLRNSKEYRPVLLIDGSKTLQRLIISGLRGVSPSALHHFSEIGRIKEIFLALPSVGQDRKKRILRDIHTLGCKVSKLPSYETILRTGGFVPSLRPIEADDLLDRDGI
jgi:FlaA1/EpsC-like NDP-sugar epimerase